MLFRIKEAKDKEAVKSYVDQLPAGKLYNVKIVQHRERRSVDQNSLYWLWLACISDETGEDKDDLHDLFKQKYLGFQQKNIFPGREFGTTVYKELTTTRMDTLEFTQYLKKVKGFALHFLGIVLPEPEDQYWNQFYEQYKNYI